MSFYVLIAYYATLMLHFCILQPFAPCLADFCEVFGCCGDQAEKDAEVDEESGEVIQESLVLLSKSLLQGQAAQRRISRCRSALERCFEPPSSRDAGSGEGGVYSGRHVEAFAIDMCIELEGGGGADAAAGRLGSRGGFWASWGGYLVWLALICAVAGGAIWANASQDAAMNLQPYVGQLQRGFRAVRGAVPWSHRRKEKSDPRAPRLKSGDPQSDTARRPAAQLSEKHAAAVADPPSGWAGRAEGLLKRRPGGGGGGSRAEDYDESTRQDSHVPPLHHASVFRPPHETPAPPLEHAAVRPSRTLQSVAAEHVVYSDMSSDDSDGFVVESQGTRANIAPGLRPLAAVNHIPQG